MFSVAQGVDEAARVLDAHADAKAPRFHGNAPLVQHREHIAGAVTCGENDGICAKLALAFGVCIADSRNTAVMKKKVIGFCSESDFSTERPDFLAKSYDHLTQAVGADVRRHIP